MVESLMFSGSPFFPVVLTLTGSFRIRRMSATPRGRVRWHSWARHRRESTVAESLLLCMTDPFATGMIEGRVLDARSRRSEESDILQVPTIAVPSWSFPGMARL
jgi:hypothetical protein